MTLHDVRPAHSTHRRALVRFVASGLLATVESFRRGGLPLPRLARELQARTDVLAELGPPARVLTRLRWLHREVSRLDCALRDAGRTELDPDERAQLATTLGGLRDTLVTLLAPDPLDPAGAARVPAAIAARTTTVLAGQPAATVAHDPAGGEWSSTVMAMLADRVATDRVATDRVATDRVAADRVATDRVAADRVAADRVAADRRSSETARCAPSNRPSREVACFGT